MICFGFSELTNNTDIQSLTCAEAFELEAADAYLPHKMNLPRSQELISLLSQFFFGYFSFNTTFYILD